nr:hypothetical protein [Cyanobium sp. LEGE 06113]
MLARLEELSRARPDRVLRLRGSLEADPLELLIFRGFSCSTTHPTAFDPDQPVLPAAASLESAELLQGPLTPGSEVVLAGPLPASTFLEPQAWL